MRGAGLNKPALEPAWWWFSWSCLRPRLGRLTKLFHMNLRVAGASFDDIEDCVEHLAQIGAAPASFGGFGQHRFEIFPLGIGETRSVFGVFHRLNGSFRLKLTAKSKGKSQQLI